jgi:XTP/dITP diphosphohydrolase
MKTILVATTNQGKLRDFAGAADSYGIAVQPVPGFATLPEVHEDGTTFAANAIKKAEAYSRQAPGHFVLADDSGLEVLALKGAPGLHSARYAASAPNANADDAANNTKLLRELAPYADRSARFVCVIAVARDGRSLATFEGEASGIVLTECRGTDGFGYDPLFFVPAANKTFAEMDATEKAQYSHRGAAFRKFLDWLTTVQG